MPKAMVEEPIREAACDVELKDLYALMVLIRRFEEPQYRKFREGKIGGYVHRSDGQEAIVAGIISQLRLPGDYVLCTYRDHAQALAVGTDPGAVMAEILGRSGGCAGGKGGSMHLIDPDRGFLGGDGIVGGPVPIAVGVGWAIKYRGDDNVCVCYFGDGAMNQGGVHESLNMAGLYKLPILFVLENNKYAMGTALERSTGQPDFVMKANAHGIRGERVDGMDVIKVREAAKRAIQGIRKTGEPYFFEMDCYRFVGHGYGDDSTQGQKFYRTEEEVAQWRERDPIQRLRRHLETQGTFRAGEADDIDADAKRRVDAAVAFAESSPEPPLDSLYDHIFS